MDDARSSLIPTFLTEQLERVANRALQYAPLTRLQLQKLQGKSFGIELQRPHFPLLISGKAAPMSVSAVPPWPCCGNCRRVIIPPPA